MAFDGSVADESSMRPRPGEPGEAGFENGREAGGHARTFTDRARDASQDVDGESAARGGADHAREGSERLRYEMEQAEIRMQSGRLASSTRLAQAGGAGVETASRALDDSGREDLGDDAGADASRIARQAADKALEAARSSQAASAVANEAAASTGRFAEAAREAKSAKKATGGIARLRAKTAAQRMAARASQNEAARVASGTAANAIRIASPAKAILWPAAMVLLAILLLVGVALAFSSCAGIIGGIDSSQEEDVGPLEGVEAEIAQFLLDKGLGDVQVAAILGNIVNEAERDANGNIDVASNVNYDGVFSYRYERAVGIFQYTHASNSIPPMRGHGCIYCAFMDWCTDNSKNWADLQAQLEFFWTRYTASWWARSYHIVSSASTDPPAGTAVGGSRRGFEGTDDVAQATREFCYGFEAPGVPRISQRIADAERFYEALTSASYVEAAIAIAADDTHGYSMANRTMNPDVDCSSLVYYAMLQSGYTVSQLGGTWPFTTDTMPSILPGIGFERHAFTGVGSLKRGDILLRSGHTEIYIGDGQNVGAHTNYDGVAGDSSGEEVDISPCGTNWDCYYRKKIA